jgi:hypothetical protein
MSGLISVAVINMHPSKCSSVRHILVLDLMFFMKLNSCLQQKVLPNTDDITKCVF